MEGVSTIVRSSMVEHEYSSKIELSSSKLVSSLDSMVNALPIFEHVEDLLGYIRLSWTCRKAKQTVSWQAILRLVLLEEHRRFDFVTGAIVVSRFVLPTTSMDPWMVSHQRQSGIATVCASVSSHV